MARATSEILELFSVSRVGDIVCQMATVQITRQGVPLVTHNVAYRILFCLYRCLPYFVT
jgi:hypothetical protein